MIPGPWAALVLTLGAYRIVRLIGWDDLPPIERFRAWIVGAELVRRGTQASLAGLTSEEPELVWTFRRPVLDHFLHCAFCVGAWLSLVTYLLWVFFPVWTLYGLAPFALSAAVGLIAKNLDP